MTITVRLPEDLETKLRRRLKKEGKALSDFVREAIAEKIGREVEAKPSAWELGKHLFGKHGDGDPLGSTERKKRVHEALDAKHRRR